MAIRIIKAADRPMPTGFKGRHDDEETKDFRQAFLSMYKGDSFDYEYDNQKIAAAKCAKMYKMAKDMRIEIGILNRRTKDAEGNYSEHGVLNVYRKCGQYRPTHIQVVA